MKIMPIEKLKAAISTIIEWNTKPYWAGSPSDENINAGLIIKIIPIKLTTVSIRLVLFNVFLNSYILTLK